MYKIFGVLMLAIMLVLSIQPAFADGFGALGDSMTDEYVGSPSLTETDLPAYNWVQLLIGLRGIDFGGLEMDPAVRGEPRLKGYEYNWARSGATANEVPPWLMSPYAGNIMTQAAGLAPKVTAGNVDIVFIGVGHNDYFYRDLIAGGYVSGLHPELFILDDHAYLAFEDAVFNAIFTAVDTIIGATTVDPAKVLLAKLPPDSLDGVAHLIPAMAHLNTRLEAEVADRQSSGQVIKLVDLYDWGIERYDAEGNLLFGGYILPPDSKASLAQTVPEGTPDAGPCDSSGNCSTLDYTLNLVCHDTPGGHPGTIMQGLIANQVIEAVNPWLDTPIEPLSDLEVLHSAAPVVPIPELPTVMLITLGLLALGGLIWYRRRTVAVPA